MMETCAVQEELRYKWLVTDLDGTLLDEQQRVPAVNREALAAFRQAGGRVAFATGRIEAAAAAYMKELEIVEPCILYNGARIVDPTTAQVLWSQVLPDGVAATVAKVLAAALDGPYHPVYYADGEAWVGEITPTLATYAAKDNLRLRVDPGLEMLSSAVTKVLIIAPEREMERLTSVLERHLTGVSYVRSEPQYLEVLPQGCNKGTALTWLASRLGFDLTQTLAIGDNMNDLEMLQTAGLGVAVANANPQLLAAASAHVGPGPTGGVAEAIERFCFKNASEVGAQNKRL